MLAGVPGVDDLRLEREAFEEGPAVRSPVGDGIDPVLGAHAPEILSGRWLGCITVPAVTEIWRPQSVHSRTQRLSFSSQPFVPPHAGQAKPSPQRRFARRRAQASSFGKSSSNSCRDIGQSSFQRRGVIGTLSEQSGPSTPVGHKMWTCLCQRDKPYGLNAYAVDFAHGELYFCLGVLKIGIVLNRDRRRTRHGVDFIPHFTAHARTGGVLWRN